MVQVPAYGYTCDPPIIRTMKTGGTAFDVGDVVTVKPTADDSIPGVSTIYAQSSGDGDFVIYGVVIEKATAQNTDTRVMLRGRTRAKVYRFTSNVVKNSALVPAKTDAGSDRELVLATDDNVPANSRKVVGLADEVLNASNPGDNTAGLFMVLFDGINGFAVGIY